MKKDARVKIAFFLGAFRPGGTEKYTVRLLQAISKEKFDPHVLCFQKDGDLLTEVEALGCPIKAIPMSANGLSYLKAVFRVVFYLRRADIQVLYTLGNWADWIGGIGGKLAHVPALICTMRNMGHMLTKKRYRLATQFIYKYLADGVIVNAQSIQGMLADDLRVAPEKIVVFPNLVPTKELRILPYKHPKLSGKIVGGFVGTLKPIKGFDLLISAVGSLGEDSPDLCFLVVGDGPDASDYQEEVRRKGLDARFHFVGYQRDIFRFMAAMDFLVLPSRSEGFPTVVWEAMACKKPVIATRVGGVSEVVRDGETGLLIEPEKTDLLIQAIKGMCKDPERRRRMGADGRIHFEARVGADGGIAKHEAYFLKRLGKSKALATQCVI